MSDTGSLNGTVTTNGSNPLPEATITVSGQGAPQVQLTDAQGRFQFPGLLPGSYSVAAQEMEYSRREYPNVSITAGNSTELDIELEIAFVNRKPFRNDATLFVKTAAWQFWHRRRKD